MLDDPVNVRDRSTRFGGDYLQNLYGQRLLSYHLALSAGSSSRRRKRSHGAMSRHRDVSSTRDACSSTAPARGCFSTSKSLLSRATRLSKCPTPQQVGEPRIFQINCPMPRLRYGRGIHHHLYDGLCRGDNELRWSISSGLERDIGDGDVFKDSKRTRQVGLGHIPAGPCREDCADLRDALDGQSKWVRHFSFHPHLDAQRKDME